MLCLLTSVDVPFDRDKEMYSDDKVSRLPNAQ
jgi:hypothetical protein